MTTYDYDPKVENISAKIYRELIAKGFTPVQIATAKVRLRELINETLDKHGGDPCNECGSTELLKTGTCAVCVTCGTSQGCS